MNIFFHRNFKKQYQKLLKPEQQRFKEKIKIFLDDEFNAILNNHFLKGKYLGYRSINITGDLRAIYQREARGKITFVAIGKHRHLYH